MKKIEDTTVCIDRVTGERHGHHCATCRDRIGGRKWRASKIGVFEVPGNVVDYECPFRLPWSDGLGPTPSDKQPPLPPPPTPRPPGPGTILRRLIKRRHGVQQCAAGCGDLAARMDRNGPDWCEAHADGIVAEMMSRTDKLRWYQRWAVALAPAVAEAEARKLVAEAIRIARTQK